MILRKAFLLVLWIQKTACLDQLLTEQIFFEINLEVKSELKS